MARNTPEECFLALQTRRKSIDTRLRILEPLDEHCDDMPLTGNITPLGFGGMIRLTCGIFGLQLVFSALMSSATPYLRSLGLTKQLTAIVLSSGPIAGAIGQPVVGALSDRCQHPWGRRTPFIVGGTFFCILSMLSLVWVKESTHLFAVVLNLDHSSDVIKTAIVIGASFWVCAVNMAVAPLQAGLRAFIIDNCPQQQQVEANAWAGRMTGFGNTLGYTLGMLPLPRLLPWLGDTQFKAQFSIASVILSLTVATCCLTIKEEAPIREKADRRGTSLTAIFWQLCRSVKTLPPVTRQVCKVQFFAWMGWFPFLFYITSYIGELYSRPILARVASQPDSADLREALWNRAVRVGVSGSFLFALISVVTSLVAPSFVSPTTRRSSRPRKTTSLPKVSLPRLWMLSHLFFSLSTFLTILARTETWGRVFVGMAGVSWTMTMWAPFALISAEISGIESDRQQMAAGEMDVCPDIKAGVVIGLHNVAIATPQILSALVASVVLKALQAFGVEDTFGWLLRLAGLPALIAAYLARDMCER
ncbi:major facilitator superfamily domain-containing protein [Xylariaceae sp. FL0594]|nr:major facilitator superfamily domain-containing protein [Xylariaceae sp. FL0594]